MEIKETEQPRKRKKLYYGWLVFGVSFLMVLVTLGFGSSPKSTYLKAITESLGLSRGGFSVNDLMRYVVTAVLNFFFGAIVRKLKARRMIALGFLSLVLSFVINGFATDYWHFYIGGALLGAGLAWTTTTVVGYVVENWFTNNKGTMMGIILAANGLGGFLSEPVVTKLIYGVDGNLTEADARWRLAYFVTAGLFAVVGIIVVLIIRDRPEDKGLKPLGQDKPAAKKRGASWTGYELKDVYRKPFFYISGLAVFAVGFTLQSLSSVAKPYMYDIGISKELVIRIYMLGNIVLMFAKMGFGFLFDRLGIRITYALCAVSAAVALFILYLVTPGSSWALFPYIVISNFGYPLETVMIPLLVAELFGRKPFSHVMGYYLAFNYLGFATGSVISNLSYDAMGTYRYMIFFLFISILVSFAVAEFSMAIAKRDRKKFEAEEAAKAEQAAVSEPAGRRDR